MDQFPSGMDRFKLEDELIRFERVSRFPETSKNLFDEGPHLVSTAELPWGDEIRHQSIRAYERFVHGETWMTGGGAREMEAEIVGWMGGLLGAPEATGFVTGGGSESNMCAILTAKERAGRGGSVVFPTTGHYSIYKLCRMFGLEAITVPPMEGSLCQIDPAGIEAAIRDDTIAIIATAGTWAYGGVDPIAEIGRIAERHSIFLHVDAAFGGFILPFLERSHYAKIEPWDFRVPGVCSISADLHKNGMAPPPAGSLYFRDSELLDAAKAICPPNGTMSGTRGAGPIAGAWTMMKLLGEAGYTAVSRCSIGLRDAITEGVGDIEGLAVYPGSQINISLIYSDHYDLRPVVEVLRERGWMFSARAVPAPASIVSVTMPHNAGKVEPFLDDLTFAMTKAVPLGDDAPDAQRGVVSTYGF